jgi:chemotaxis response regulator CheB
MAKKARAGRKTAGAGTARKSKAKKAPAKKGKTSKRADTSVAAETATGAGAESQQSPEPESPAAQAGPAADFPVVGIGASAGGLKALEQLLDSMPGDTGMASVLIQHLDPTRSSLTAELLAKHTSMTVAEVRDETPVRPNCVRSLVDLLSDREMEIFRLIGEGLNTHDIARQLHLSPNTVGTYRERLKTKLNATNGADLNRKAMQWMLENG